MARSALVLILCMASALAADAQTVTMRYRWTKGEARTYRVTTETNRAISGTPDGRDLTNSQAMTQVLKIVAEDVAPDGAATLRQTFQSVRMEGTGPMGKVVIDTAAPDSTPDPMMEGMRRVLEAMAGESVTIVMAPDGTVQKVSGAARIAEKITKVMSGDPSAGAAGQGIRTMLSDDALKNTFEQSFCMLPAGPVKAGETWTSHLAMGNETIGRIVGTSTFTLKAIDGGPDAPVANIGVSLALKQEVVPTPTGPTPMVMRLRDNRGDGEIVFDVTRGHIQRSTMRTDTSSTVTMNGPDGTPTTVQNKTTTKMTMELVGK
jgi:hypothetical protein